MNKREQTLAGLNAVIQTLRQLIAEQSGGEVEAWQWDGVDLPNVISSRANLTVRRVQDAFRILQPMGVVSQPTPLRKRDPGDRARPFRWTLLRPDAVIVLADSGFYVVRK